MTTTTRATVVSHDSSRVGAWMQAHEAGFYRDGCVCIGCERDGLLVAGVMYDYYNGASIFAHIAITGRFSKEWLYAICHYPFVHLECKVVIGLVAKGNVKSQRFDENFGFRKRVELYDADPSGSMYIYTLLKNECRFLRRTDHESPSAMA